MAEQNVRTVRGPGGRGAMGRPRPKVANPGKLIKRVLGEVFKHYAPHCLVVLVCIFLSAFANVQASLFLQTLIDDYIAPMLQQQNPDFGPLLGALGRIACIYLVGILAAWANARIMVNVTQGTMRNIRTELFTHMESLPIRYFDTHPHGDIMSVYTNDVDTLRQMISQSIPQLVSSVITIVSVLVSMLLLDIPMTILTLCMVGLMLFCSKKISAQSGKYFISQQRDLGAVNGYIEEMLEGQKVVKVFTHETKTLEGFRDLNNKLRESSIRANGYANIMMPVNAQLGNVSYALCALLGAALAVGGVGGVTLGTVMAFLALNKSFNMPISQVSMQANSVIMALAGAERIYAMMDAPSETDDGYVTLVNAKYDKDNNLVESDQRTGLWAWKHPHHDGTLTYTKLEGDIRFFDVDFGYTPEKTVLHDINLYGLPGQKIAFVGSTGAGKTTITNLINRFYDIQDGKIRYDGINIRKIKKADLRRSLGIVLQDTHLFTGTVMDNIRYGRLDATDEECVVAAKLANADGFIRRLPDGYNTMLTGDGANLSQGQRQLLAIARAAVADPPVLILDEATSSIDTRTEALVQSGMDRHGRPDVRPHHLRHRPPAVHRPQRRLHHRPGTGAHHRARQPRRTDRQKGQVLPAVHRQPGRVRRFPPAGSRLSRRETDPSMAPSGPVSRPDGAFLRPVGQHFLRFSGKNAFLSFHPRGFIVQ